MEAVTAQKNPRIQFYSKFFFRFSAIPGCLLEGPPPPLTAPPDVPPRNPTMSRMNGRVQGIANDLDMDFEPSCLVRTPSGNVYIPSGNLSKFDLAIVFGLFRKTNRGELSWDKHWGRFLLRLQDVYKSKSKCIQEEIYQWMMISFAELRLVRILNFETHWSPDYPK